MGALATFETVQLQQEAGVLVISLNRPDVLNAVNDKLGGELLEALKQADRDPSVRAVVLTGAGRGFCSGQDLKDRAAAQISYRDSIRRRYNPIILRMWRMEKPLIAAVNGVAAGAGCSLALAADFRIASDRASFIELFSRIGLVPDSGSTYFLPRLVGLGRALELAYTAEPVDAARALQLGLVNRVVAHDELMAHTLDFAKRLAAGPTKAFGLTKRAMTFGLHATLEQALDYEADVQEIAGRTADHREGIAAFTEKRPPQFRGS